MFSEEDILDIYGFLSPDKQTRSEDVNGLPLLIRTNSGQGFITERKIHQEFERLAREGHIRVSLSDFSNKLDVNTDVVLHLVQSTPALALLDQAQQHIVPQQVREECVRTLEEALDLRLVIRSDLARELDLGRKSFDSLLQDPAIKESLAEITDDYLLGKEYKKVLSEAITRALIEAVDKPKTIQFSPQSLPGEPPIWLIRRQLDEPHKHPTSDVDLLSQTYIEDKADIIQCTPKKVVAGKRDGTLRLLQEAHELTILDLKVFYQHCKALYPSLEAVKEDFASFPYVVIFGDHAVAERILRSSSDTGVQEIQDRGYTNLKAIKPIELRGSDIVEEAQNYIAQKTMTAASSHGKSVRRIRNFILTKDKLDSQREALSEITKAYAMRQWEALKETPDKDLKFKWGEAIRLVPEDNLLLKFLSYEKDSESAAAERFAATISDLESQNETDFATHWTEKVLLRCYNYQQSLESVEDAKLRDQLSELLSSYLHKDLLPDSVSKAQSQGLVRSSRTRKNVAKFETTLKGSKTDLASVISTLDKFGKKQGLSELDSNAAEEAKKTLLHDMVRRMQKPKTDAPLMFLSLAIVLFAKSNPGVVYATGKFAPKLLKQLKTKLSNEDYEQAEKWKEQAKAGTLAKEDREAMIQMAEQITS